MDNVEQLVSGDNVEQLVTGYITREFLHDKPVSLLDNGNLVDEGVIDSLAILMLINYIENEFKVHIEVEDIVLENFESVAAISQLVRQRSAV